VSFVEFGRLGCDDPGSGSGQCESGFSVPFVGIDRVIWQAVNAGWWLTDGDEWLCPFHAPDTPIKRRKFG
jgi:hypothetical protein